MKKWQIMIVSCLAASGCGKTKAPPQAETVPIRGTVRLDGLPLAGADVVFMPLAAESTFAGRTKDDGSYALVGAAGSVRKCYGKCIVTIGRPLKADGTPLGEHEPPANVGAHESLPPWYAQPAATQLWAEVPEGGGQFDFALTTR